MTTASIHSTDTPNAEVIHDLVAALDTDAISLGQDDASRCVRADVKALRAAIEGVAGTVASTLLAKRRDGGVVDRARLEIESAHAC